MCNPSIVAKPTRDAPKEAQDATANMATKDDNYKMPPSGFERRRQWVEMGLLLLSVCYGCVYYWNPHFPVDPSLCSPTESTTDEGTCLRPDLIAYKVTALFAMSTMGLMGTYHWHFSPQLKHLQLSSAQDRLLGYLAASDYQNVVIFCWQCWDLAMAIVIPENRDPLFLLHHVLAIITAYCSLEYQMMSYYSIFYGGCSELSSIFLIFVSNDNLFVDLAEGGWLETWLLICKAMFFVTFTAYRIVGWIYYSFPLWKDCQQMTDSGMIEKYRPGKTFVVRLFQGLDVALGALQCYWYSQILQTLAGLLFMEK